MASNCELTGERVHATPQIVSMSDPALTLRPVTLPIRRRGVRPGREQALSLRLEDRVGSRALKARPLLRIRYGSVSVFQRFSLSTPARLLAAPLRGAHARV